MFKHQVVSGDIGLQPRLARNRCRDSINFSIAGFLFSLVRVPWNDSICLPLYHLLFIYLCIDATEQLSQQHSHLFKIHFRMLQSTLRALGSPIIIIAIRWILNDGLKRKLLDDNLCAVVKASNAYECSLRKKTWKLSVVWRIENYVQFQLDVDDSSARKLNPNGWTNIKW